MGQEPGSWIAILMLVVVDGVARGVGGRKGMR